MLGEIQFVMVNGFINERPIPLVGFVGENDARQIKVVTFDDMSTVSVTELVIGDIEAGIFDKEQKTVSVFDRLSGGYVDRTQTTLSIYLNEEMLGKSGLKFLQLVMYNETGEIVKKTNQFIVRVGDSNVPVYYAPETKTVKTLEAYTKEANKEAVKLVFGLQEEVTSSNDFVNKKVPYVYKGNEEDYQNGYWYYYDDTKKKWVPGGPYKNPTDEVLNLLEQKQDALVFDSTPTENSQNPVTSDGVFKAISEHQVTMDESPINGSTNPVTSDGLYRKFGETNAQYQSLSTRVDGIQEEQTELVNDIQQNTTDIAQNASDISSQGATITEHQTSISHNAEAIEEVRGIANSASTKADAVDARLDNIIVESGTSDAETIAARTNTNTGVTYTTLGQRLDAENSEIKEDLSAVCSTSRNLFNIENLASTNVTVTNGVAKGTAKNFKNETADGINVGFTFEADTQYIISLKGRTTNGSDSLIGLALNIYYTDDSTPTTLGFHNSYSDFTEVSNCTTSGKTVSKVSFIYSNGANNIWEVKDFQIEKGRIQTDFVPYSTANDEIARGTADDISIVSKNTANANTIATSIVGETLDVPNELFELGNITINSNKIVYNTSDTRVRTCKSKTVYLKAGTVVSMTTGVFYIGFVDRNGEITHSGWNTSYTMPEDGACYLLLRYSTEETVTDLDALVDGLAFTPPAYTLPNFVLGNLASFPLRFKPCYDHLFVNDEEIVIPHESVYHVRLSKSMGFNVIEANVAGKTSDGVFIVNHLNNGKFGRYFYALNGDDISNVAVNSMTWNEIVENVRYNTEIIKYRTRPCTLEEFLMECRQQNIIPFIQSTLAGVLDIADDIMGKYNYIAYGVSRADCPDGIIYHWKNFTTKEEILSYCKSIGKPFIYGMSNPTSFSDANLQDIVNTLHSNGYWIGTSYADDKWHKYSHMGFDALGALKCINRIKNGNVCNINSMFGFGGFTFTNATETDGVLTYSADGTLIPTFTAETLSVGGVDLEMCFNGTITVPAIGQTSAKAYTSDGSYPVFLAVSIINGNPALTLAVSSGTVVYDVSYKASKF